MKYSSRIKALLEGRIIGTDEVGTGPLAGPIVCGAVATPIKIPEFWSDLRDSKKLSEKKREYLFTKIALSGIPWATFFIYPDEIESIGHTNSLKKAFQEVILKIKKEFSLPSEICVIIDGTHDFDIGYPIIKADVKIKEVSAASICAKVVRDRYMHSLDSVYPEYGFGTHKGYGTPQHMDAILKFGVTNVHRKNTKPIAEILNGANPKLYSSLDNRDN